MCRSLFRKLGPSCLGVAAFAIGACRNGEAEPRASTPTAAEALKPTPAVAPAPAAHALENGAASCSAPQIPAFEQLPVTEALPDPFVSLGGERITQKAQWPCRRAEISALVQEFELGPKPPKPSIVSGAVADGAVTITAGEPSKTVQFSVKVSLPATGKAPYPAVIQLGQRFSLDESVFAEAGVARIEFDNNAMGAQAGPDSRGKGTFYDLYGADHGASSMMAWAWGVSRVIDALESTPEIGIDPARLAVTGCSRNGKGALVVGAFDERIALTIAQESGAGGSASWRISQVMEDAIIAKNPKEVVNNRVQTLASATGEQPWFRASFAQFNQAVTKLPFDHHLVMAMVAPRGLLVVDNTSMSWLGNVSSYTNAVAAHEVWTALGVPDAMGASQIGDHDHCKYPASQRPELVAFVAKFLKGDASADTRVLRTDGSFEVDRKRWMPWSTPALQ